MMHFCFPAQLEGSFTLRGLLGKQSCKTAVYGRQYIVPSLYFLGQLVGEASPSAAF